MDAVWTLFVYDEYANYVLLAEHLLIYILVRITYVVSETPEHMDFDFAHKGYDK